MSDPTLGSDASGRSAADLFAALRRSSDRLSENAQATENLDVEGQIRMLRADAEARRSGAEDSVRAFVTKTAIVGYVVLLAACALIAFTALFLQMSNAQSIVATGIDLLLKAGLPVVTLVLGYYFGSASK